MGWYMAFQLNVVVDSAGGERDLPPVATGDVMEGILLPLVKFLASWVVALVPFALGMVYLIMFDQMSFNTARSQYFHAITGDFAPAFDSDVGGSSLLGIILLSSMMTWPMMV